jgi:D-inositol-3-phosphate glycosyltransferase
MHVQESTVGDDPAPPEIDVALLTGGQDRHYAFGLAMSLVGNGVKLQIIGSDELDSPEMHTNPDLTFLNLRGNQLCNVRFTEKILRVLTYYARLIAYAFRSEPKIFHILWNNRIEFFDRTLLTLYYKLLGKKVTLTAHNVNAGKRDSTDNILNRLTLRIQYQLVDFIFVHTRKMKQELVVEFGIQEGKVKVIPYGINNAIPITGLSSREAKGRLGLAGDEKTILFFGAIAPYKGLEFLVAAFQQISAENPDYRLIIAGKPKGGCGKYLEEILKKTRHDVKRGRIVEKIGYVPDDDVEIYFKAADLLVLPYTQIFQSGIFFLGYSFGVPLIASDVGSFREDIVEGQTGFLCRPGDADDLARTIERYFASDLFQQLDRRRQEIQQYARASHSWDVVGEMTRTVYTGLLQKGV